MLVCALAVDCVLQFVFRFPWLSYVGVLLFGLCDCLLILLVLGGGQLWLFGVVGLHEFACFWGLWVWGLWLVYASVCFVFGFAVAQFSCSSRVRFAGLFLGCLSGLLVNGCVFLGGVWYCVLFCCAPCLCLLLVRTFGFVVVETVFAWIAGCGLIALLIACMIVLMFC